mgnify:FL=1
MANEDSILYLPRNIELIPNTVLTKGLVWLKPNIIKPIKSQLKSDLDIIWYDKEQYFAQSISFKETEKIANAVGGVLRDKFNNIFIQKTNFENLEMDTVKIMGILNVTPDSFYDGGNYNSENKALEHAKKMRDHGADIIDVGGESTKPNAEYVSDKEETNRVLRIIKELSKEGYLVSADTRKHSVMEKAIDNGAKIINDISGMSDPLTPSLISKNNVSIVIMHMQGTPETMQIQPSYQFAPIEIYNFLEHKINVALSAGIKKNKIAIDPGFGFGKNPVHNMQIMAWLPMFQTLGVPVLLGASRKSTIAALSNNEVANDRMAGSISLLCYANILGLQIIRVHDVFESNQALNISNYLNKRF